MFLFSLTCFLFLSDVYFRFYSNPLKSLEHFKTLICFEQKFHLHYSLNLPLLLFIRKYSKKPCIRGFLKKSKQKCNPARMFCYGYFKIYRIFIFQNTIVSLWRFQLVFFYMALHKIYENTGFHWPVLSRILQYFVQCGFHFTLSILLFPFSGNVIRRSLLHRNQCTAISKEVIIA